MGWLTVPEVAEELRLGERTVRKLIAVGGLPAFRLGRLVRVRREDLEAWLTRQRLLPAEPTSRRRSR